MRQRTILVHLRQSFILTMQQMYQGSQVGTVTDYRLVGRGSIRDWAKKPHCQLAIVYQLAVSGGNAAGA
jgi:hypothetical protein